jgi:3'-phosphoadenosine 5'-phosphosulfate (PAPS) 3'-phosphatase
VLQLDGRPLDYNAKEDILNPHFLVRGPTDQDWLAIIAAGE